MKFPYQRVTGITPGMSGFYLIENDAYHAGIGISSTKVKKALRSYAQYAAEEPIDSAALAFGRAFHDALLEPHLFRSRYTVMPEFDGHPNSNIYKAAKADWLGCNQGKEVLSSDEASLIQRMIVAVQDHPKYADFGTKYNAEVMACHTCPETGLLLKCKMDLFADSIVDFKSTSGGVTPAEFTQALIKFNYHVSAAFYQDIVTALTGVKYPFIIVPVSKPPQTRRDAPIEVEFYQITDDVLDQGRQLYKAGLKRIAKWAILTEESRKNDGKRLRLLNLSPRIVYSTQDTLSYIEGT